MEMWLFMVGMAVWWVGCLIACAIVVTSPVGALTCWHWARKHNLDVAACTRRGAFYWMAGFVPWLYFIAQLNHWPIPNRIMVAVYLALFIAWLWAPVYVGFFWTISIDTEVGDWLALHPTVSMIVLVVSLICLAFVKTLLVTPQRLHYCRVVPSLLGTLSMLGWLPYPIYFWMQ